MLQHTSEPPSLNSRSGQVGVHELALGVQKVQRLCNVGRHLQAPAG